MVAAVQLERRMVDAQVFCVIVIKLSYREMPGPVIMLEVYKGLELRFYGIVLFLSLIVSLREKSDRKPPFNTKKVAEQ